MAILCELLSEYLFKLWVKVYGEINEMVPYCKVYLFRGESVRPLGSVVEGSVNIVCAFWYVDDPILGVKLHSVRQVPQQLGLPVLGSGGELACWLKSCK